MRKLFYLMGCMIIIGHTASEAHSIALLLFPSITTIYVEDWVRVTMPKGMHLNLQWFLYLAGQDFMICCFIFVGGLQAWCQNYKSYLEWRPFNHRLYIMWGIYFFYHFADSAMLYINYKQGIVWYWALLALTTAGVICLMWPIKQATGKYRSLV